MQKPELFRRNREFSRIRIAELTETLGVKIERPDPRDFFMQGEHALTPQVMDSMSYSHVVDVTDPDKSRAVLAVGNSEIYEDPHCRDQIDMWQDFGMRPAPLSSEKLETMAVSKVILKSAGR